MSEEPVAWAEPVALVVQVEWAAWVESAALAATAPRNFRPMPDEAIGSTIPSIAVALRIVTVPRPIASVAPLVATRSPSVRLVPVSNSGAPTSRVSAVQPVALVIAPAEPELATAPLAPGIVRWVEARTASAAGISRDRVAGTAMRSAADREDTTVPARVAAAVAAHQACRPVVAEASAVVVAVVAAGSRSGSAEQKS